MAKIINNKPAGDAAEMRQRSRDRELELLRTAIAEEAAKGKFRLLLNITLSDHAVLWLRERGYTVKSEWITRFTSVYW